MINHKRDAEAVYVFRMKLYIPLSFVCTRSTSCLKTKDFYTERTRWVIVYIYIYIYSLTEPKRERERLARFAIMAQSGGPHERIMDPLLI